MATENRISAGHHRIEFQQNLISIDGVTYGIGQIPGDVYQTLSKVERWSIWRYLDQYRLSIESVPSVGDAGFYKFFGFQKGATHA